MGSKALEAIIEEREKSGFYETIFNLCERVDQQKVNKRVLESLIMSGAMDKLEGNRAHKYECVDEAIKYGHQLNANINRDQVDLFSLEGSKNELIRSPRLPSVTEWGEQESLRNEIEVLGLYVSGHPLLEHSEDLEEFTSIDLGENQKISKDRSVIIVV